MNAQENKDHRLSVSELTQLLENASMVYRHQDISHSQFFELKERFKQLGIEGLKDLSPNPKTNFRKTSPLIVEKILTLSLQHPGWGCVRLAKVLKTQGNNLSSPTIQKILTKNELGNKIERLNKLEGKVIFQDYHPNEEQLRLLEKVNPCFRERFNESVRPGEILSQDTILISKMKGIGKIYLQSVVDTYNSYAFGLLHNRKLPDYAVTILHNEVLPFYTGKNLTIKNIITNNSREYCGTGKHHYELYLLLNEIEHQKTKLHDRKINGFVERFNRIAQEEFFNKVLSNRFYESLEDLQHDFDHWLNYYNNQRPHLGYRNMGKPPIAILNEYLNKMP